MSISPLVGTRLLGRLDNSDLGINRNFGVMTKAVVS